MSITINPTPIQPKRSGRNTRGAPAMTFRFHQPMSLAPQREPITKNTSASICMAKPSPTRISVPDAQPPAMTMPMPNMMPPTTVARLTGMT